MDKQSQEDIWDDSLLIKAYDRSIKLAKEELAKKIAESTNTHAEKLSNKEASQPDACESKPMSFKVGEHVRATYDDGVDYEAKIIEVEDETCKIRYIGYDNIQEVKTCDLLPSWGKNARKQQFSEAKQQEKKSDAEVQEKKKNKIKASVNLLPPPPPMPPMLNDLNEDSESISAMLMSWYMSGYYTGLYQGQKMARQSSKNKK